MFILFDCMETLIDVDGFSEPKDYAYYAFKGSGMEFYWDGFDAFYQVYMESRKAFDEYFEEHQEYQFLALYTYLVQANVKISEDFHDQAVSCLLNNYWQNYLVSCRIDDAVIETIKLLFRKHKLGIISNFKVAGGIETLLEKYGLTRFFEFIITSADFGWRKPYDGIYQAAMDKTGLPAEEHIFVGDDPECDYYNPRRMGMKAILLDKTGKYPDIEDRVSSLTELPGLDILS